MPSVTNAEACAPVLPRPSTARNSRMSLEGPMRSRHALARAIAPAIAVLLSLLAIPTAAHAVKVERIFAGPITASSTCNPEGNGATLAPQAAAYNDFCFALRTTSGVKPGGDDLRQTIIDSPAGVLANVDIAPQCDPAKFAAKATTPAACGIETQVGAANAAIRADVAGLPIPLNVRGRVFNLWHTNNEVGLLGIQLDPTLGGLNLPKSKILLRFTLRPSPDVGLRAVADGLPRFADSGLGLRLPIAIDTFGFRFWGSKVDHPTMPASFSRTGSSCEPAVTKFAATSYAGDVSDLSRTYQPTGCEKLTIGQTASVTTSERRPDVPTETVVDIRPELSATPDTVATVNPGKSVVTLPPGLMLGAQGASGPEGLPLCSNEAFALTSNAPPTCPAASATATVKFTSPNLKEPFVGKAYLGEQTGKNRLPQLMISVDQAGTAADAPRVKLLGQLTIDEQGRLVTTLSGLPDVPFTSFLLTFRGGANGVTSTPRECGTGTGESVLIPTSSATPSSTAPLSLTIDQDCVDPAAFAPTFGAAFASTQAGAAGDPTFTIERPDRSARLGKAVVHLSPGMLASLKGVPECATADAAAGNCPASTRVGKVSVKAGVGPSPTTTPEGTVYLTQRPEGAVAGLTIVAPVAFGEVNLGRLVVPARIDLRKSDLGLDLTTEVPQTFLDIPLNLRSMAVSLDRPGFSKNPTSCAPLTLGADLTSDRGTTASPQASAQMTGCEGLPFAPQVQASTPPGTKVGDSAGVTTKVALPGNQSALRSVTVTLPAGIGADLTRISRACPIADFRAGAGCENAVTGSLSGSLAILDEPIGGRVVLVKYPGETLPGIGLDIAGRFSARIEGHVKVGSTGQLVVTLDNLPDAPIDDLGLVFAPGAQSALKVSKLFCTAGKATFRFDLVGQSGAATSKTIDAPCDLGGVAGAKARKASLSGKLANRKAGTPSLRLKATGPRGTKLKSVSVRLAKGMKAVPRKTTKSFVSNKGSLKALSARSIRATLKGSGRRTVTVNLKSGTLELTKAVRRNKARLTLRVTLRYSDGVVERRTLRVR